MNYRRYQVHWWVPRKGKTCLLVIDMQNYFQDLALPILSNIKESLDLFRTRKWPVVFTAHTHRDLERDGGLLVQWWGKASMEVFTPGRWEWEIISEVAPLPGEKVVDTKTRYSAFYKTDLEDHLRIHGVTDLVICGVMTNYCCETTARDGFNRDFRIFFLADATATDDPQLHQATLCNLASGFATIYTTKELLEALR
jgi:nicotinamidase-related amidase